jgi:GWxTD domain-containing protein
MQKIIKCLLTFGLLFFLAQSQAQPTGHQNGRNKSMHFSQSRFIYTVYNFSDSTRTKSQLNVYWGFVNDILQFIRQSENEFKAQYEISVELLDDHENYLEGKTITNSITVTTFEETNSNKLKNTGLVKFIVRSGDYSLRIELTDLDTQKRMTQIQKVHLNDYSLKNITCSDLVFFENDVPNLSTGSDFPNIAANFSDSLSRNIIYFELYPLIAIKNLDLTIKILDANARIVYQNTEKIKTIGKVIPKTIDLKPLISQAGRYTIHLQFAQDKKSVSTDGHFYINWNHNNFAFNKIEDTLELLSALGNSEEFGNFKNATKREKTALLEAFWKKRDPSPETEGNEIKTEFYRRLEFVNQRFTIYFLDKPGWKTDRGQIFIKFGEPSNIEQQASEINRPAYEIWVYDSIHQRVIFVDRTGFGDFQLLKIE